MALKDLTVEQLKARAAELNVSIPEGAKKADILSLVEAAEASQEEATETNLPATPESSEDATSGGTRYFVRLLAPTPLDRNPLIVEASSPEEAKAKFCEANGIRGSRQTWRIHPATDANEAEVAELEAKRKPQPAPAPAPEPTPAPDA